MSRNGLVLIIEDDRNIADIIKIYLNQAGFGTHISRTGTEGLKLIDSIKPIAVLLDIGLPDIDGTEVCRTLRANGNWVPVLLVTARDADEEKIRGLALGADDYIVKPFNPDELIARLNVILRRSVYKKQDNIFKYGKIDIETDSREVSSNGSQISLTTLEFDLLLFMIKNTNRVITREELLSSIWGYSAAGGTRTVDVHIAQLRSKLKNMVNIKTYRSVGYSIHAI
jgi:DNA-binding response OmpR family regulator